MQSKFWAGGNVSDSESDRETSFDLPETRRPAAAIHRVLLSSSSDEEDHRVVRSLKDRRWDSMREIITQMNNHMKISDFAQICKDYESLVKLAGKASQIIEKEGYPNFLIRSIVELEAYIETKLKDKEAIKKFTKTKTTSLNTLRAKTRKLNVSWLSEMEQCQANPENFQSNDELDDSDTDSDLNSDISSEYDDKDSGEESEGDVEEPRRASKGKKLMEESGSESSWSDNEADATETWELKEKSDGAAKASRSKSSKLSKVKRGKKTERFDTTVASKSVEDLFEASAVTAEAVRNRIQMIVEKRGRRSVDKLDQTTMLKKIAEIAKTVGEQCYVEVLSHLVTAEFDTSSGSSTAQSTELWMDCYKIISQILSILESNPSYHLVDMAVAEDSNERIEENGDKRSALILTAFVERLDDELTKSLQLKDVYSDAHKSRLGDTIDMLALLCRTFDFIISKDEHEQSAVVALRVLDHVYNKQDMLAVKAWELVKKRLPNTLKFLPEGECKPSEIIDILYQTIMKHGEHREKMHALLHLAYNKSLHDHFYEARDLLQVPNMHERCLQMEVQTQILYNRNLVQLGLCAFRKGLIKEAHSYLADICAQNRHKELLAQAVSLVKNQEKSREHERAERRRLLAYHMHINLDLTEGVHNICAMLVEIPHRAQNKSSDYPISRQFSRMLEVYDSQPFQGPPENQREMVMAATKALQKGDWKECCRHVFSLNIWDKFTNPQAVKEILQDCIKTEAMRTFIFSYSNLYDSFSTAQLSLMFSLPKAQVHSIVSKMMVNEEIHASWDETSQRILISRVEISKLQQLALALADNISIAVEQNELTFNMKNQKFVLSYDRRSPFQQHGDRHHGLGNRGHADQSIGGTAARGRGNFRATRRVGQVTKYRKDFYKANGMKWSMPVEKAQAYRPSSVAF